MKDLVKSFAFALDGLADALVFERNFRVLWLVGLVVLISNYIVDFGSSNQIIFLLLIFLILALELLNSAVESCCDNQGLAHSSLIKKAKDFAAATVFLGACFSVIILSIIIYDNYAYICRQFVSQKYAFIYVLLLALANFYLCITNKPSGSALALIVLALAAHVVLGIFFTGNILFLSLSFLWHLLFIISNIKLYYVNR